jgi:hypothetical protein
MILGIISLASLLFGPGAIVGIVTGIIGLVLGIKVNKIEKQSYASAGIIMSAIGLGLCAVVFVACTACLTAAGCASMNYF